MVGIAQNTGQSAIRRRPDRRVDLIDAGGAGRLEHQIDHRDIRRRHPDRHAVQAALQFGQHQTNRLGRPGRGGDHVQCGGAAAVQVLVHGVQRRLVAGIGMDRRHEAALDADGIVQHLGDRRQTVGGARGVRHHDVIARQRMVVHAVNDGLVRAVAGGRDQHPLGAVFQMRQALFLAGEDAGAFHHDIDMGPWQVSGVPDRRHFNRTAPHVDGGGGGRHGAGKAAMDRIKAQQMGVGFDRAQIVDRNDVDIGAARFNDGPQHVAANAAEPIDGDFDGHYELLSFEAIRMQTVCANGAEKVQRLIWSLSKMARQVKPADLRPKAAADFPGGMPKP